MQQRSFPPRPARRVLQIELALWTTLCLALASSCMSSKGESPASLPLEHDGIWRLRYDNDSVLFTDGNYTSGLHLKHVTRATERMDPKHLSARLLRWLSPLPGLGRSRDRHYASYSLGQLIFTPEDLEPRNPSQEALPYTGVLFLDAGFYARAADRLIAYHLLLGVTGGPSLGEESQKTLHKALGLNRPQGWSHQSRDEPLLNLGFERHQRFHSGKLGSGLSWDVAYNLGAGLGNLFTGLNSGLRLRLGPRLPDELGATTLTTGFEASSIPLHRPAPGGVWHGFLDLESYLVARYLPVDGNLLHESRSTDGEPFVGSVSLGISYSRGGISISLAYTALSDSYEQQTESTQLGSLSVDFFP